jgi:hypothetical protein
MTSLNRRSFIGLGSLAAVGVALNAPSLSGAVSRPLKGGLPMMSGDEAALSFVQTYSSNVRVVGSTVLARIRTTGSRGLHLIAEVTDLKKMEAALPSAPFTGVYANENTLQFALPDVDVTVENLVPEAFASRMTAMTKRAGNAFAHDALAYDPATQQLSDPFHARVGGVRVVNKTFAGAAALDVALRGTVEAGQMGLAPSEDFTGWKGRIIRQIAKNKDATAMAGKFLQQLATLAERLPAKTVESLLHSRLVSTALQQVFGMNTADAIARYPEVRSKAGAAYSNAAVWLAVLLEPEIRSNAADGAALTWLQGGTRFQVVRSRKALTQAQALLEAQTPVGSQAPCGG